MNSVVHAINGAVTVTAGAAGLSVISGILDHEVSLAGNVDEHGSVSHEMLVPSVDAAGAQSLFSELSIPYQIVPPAESSIFYSGNDPRRVDPFSPPVDGFNSTFSGGLNPHQFNSYHDDVTRISSSFDSEICQIAKAWVPGSHQIMIF